MTRSLPNQEARIHASSRYASGHTSPRTGCTTISTASDWKILLRSYVINLVVYSVILIAIVLAAGNFLYPFITENFINGVWGGIATVAITLVLMAPFLWAMVL